MTKALRRYGWTKHTGFVIMLLMVFASLSMGPAYAVPCCYWNITTTYYSDAGHGTQVGRCVDSDCTGSSCTGEQTEFYTVTTSCCQRCTP